MSPSLILCHRTLQCTDHSSSRSYTSVHLTKFLDTRVGGETKRVVLRGGTITEYCTDERFVGSSQCGTIVPEGASGGDTEKRKRVSPSVTRILRVSLWFGLHCPF